MAQGPRLGDVASVAEARTCSCVITRNTRDFASSPIPALTPFEFLDSLPPVSP
jgi:hypothetical protein